MIPTFFFGLWPRRQKLARATQAKLQAAENEVLFSAASIWELGIKLQIGRLNLPVEIEEIIEVQKA